MHEREQALGKFTVLKKELYNLGIKAQSMVRSIQEETESFLSNKDFTSMDFKKVEILAVELQKIQIEYNDKVLRMNQLQATYNF